MQAEELTAKFGIAGVLDFVETEHGLVRANISLGGMAGELYLQGAQVTAWQPPDERPVLFASPNAVFAPGKAIRGGIPIIFPWFGPNRHAAAAAPQHGFARTATWHLDAVESSGSASLTLTLSLGDNDVGSQFWPEPFHAIYSVTFARTLSLRLAVQNSSSHPITFEEALHSYFAVSDITAVAISGLARTTYIDKTQAGRRDRQPAALVTVGAETDRVYLDTAARCVIEDGGWRRRVVVEKNGAASTVVWNPWARKGPGWPTSATPAGAA
jgi:glucose-6-phosphate 1-epimerase